VLDVRSLIGIGWLYSRSLGREPQTTDARRFAP